MQGEKQHKKLMQELGKLKVDSALISGADPNFYYFSGAMDFEGAFLVLEDFPKAIVPVFEMDRFKSESWIPDVEKVSSENFLKNVGAWLKGKNVGVNGKSMPHTMWEKLEKEDMKLVDVSETLENLRMIKGREEVEYLKKAAEITKKVFDKVDFEKSESDMVADFAYELRKAGADFAYESVIAYDERSALPHAKVTNGKGEKVLLVDMGAKYKGYHIDVTRTFKLKKDIELELIYSTVQDAQEMAIDAIRPGVKASEIDSVVRDYLSSAGHVFPHSTGHGVGLTVHEMPNISVNSEIVLEEGMVFTVEPGIYLSGKFGVRIEDCVLVTSKGCEVLTR